MQAPGSVRRTLMRTGRLRGTTPAGSISVTGIDSYGAKMFDPLTNIIRDLRTRRWVCDAVSQQMSLPADAVVNVTEMQSGDTPIQTVITIIEQRGVRKYRLARALADITETDIRMLPLNQSS